MLVFNPKLPVTFGAEICSAMYMPVSLQFTVLSHQQAQRRFLSYKWCRKTLWSTTSRWYHLQSPSGIMVNYKHYCDVIMGTMASRSTSLLIIYSTSHSGADHRKHQSSASLVFVRGIHRWTVNSPHKWSITRKMFPFVEVIIVNYRPAAIWINVLLIHIMFSDSIGSIWYPC